MIAAMLPIRNQSIFKSRWIALLWAGGIIWSAVEFAGGQPGAADNNQSSADGSAPDGSTPASNSSDPAAAMVAGAINMIKG